MVKKNGKGKEYYNYGFNVSFEGTYLNGKRRRKGKEYKYGSVSFEGTYLNGKRHGKGIEYGTLRFEGEFLNGYRIEGKGYDYRNRLVFEFKRNGKIKEYYYEGNLKSEIECLNGKKNGKGKYYHRNGKLKLEGEFDDGVLNGKVKEKKMVN